MTREEFLQKWATNVVEDATTDPLFDAYQDDKDKDELCQLIVRRVVLDMLYDYGYGSLDIHEALSVLREWFVNSSPTLL